MLKFAVALTLQAVGPQVVSSAHVGTPTATPVLQSVLTQAQFDPGWPAYQARPGVASFGIVTAAGALYQIPDSQLSVLATQSVPAGPLSLTLVTGSGPTAVTLQFALTSNLAAFLVSGAKNCLYADAGIRAPAPAGKSVSNRAN